MRRLASVVPLLIAAICFYGYLASFEPSPQAIYFRVGYAVVGLMCAVAGVTLLTTRRSIGGATYRDHAGG